MNKNTFMSEFSRKLRRLPKEDYEDAMRYYTEFFMDSEIDDNTDVTPIVGTVDDVAARILEEFTDKQMDKAVKEGGAKNSSRAIWYIILGIFAAPIAFPIALTIAILFFTFVVVIFAILFALLASGVAVVVAGFVAIPAIFWAETSSQILVLLGMACISIAVGVLLCYAVFKLAKIFINWIISMFRDRANKRKKTGNTSVPTQTIYSSEKEWDNMYNTESNFQNQEVK
ncbi:MAG: DUF1700 domain-containing protein [Eubacterium sp.]|nr:DUF1700 domain-containing protein [Eubacterium sp.]